MRFSADSLMVSDARFDLSKTVQTMESWANMVRELLSWKRRARYSRARLPDRRLNVRATLSGPPLFDATLFAGEIRQLMDAEALSLRGAARQADVPFPTLHRILQTRNAPDVETYLRLRRWLDGAQLTLGSIRDRTGAMRS